MNRISYIEPGAIQRMSELVDPTGARSILLVTGRASFARCGAESALKDVLAGRRVTRFSNFTANPKLHDVERGLAELRRQAPDLIIAIGGGSAMDMAKLIGVLSTQQATPREIVCGSAAIIHDSFPVIAVPTTAGTGSEATHFAAVFLDHQKYSVAHESMLPVGAIVDPELTYSLSPETTAVTGLDAFSQAVESMWSVKATKDSRQPARQAIRLALDHLPAAVARPSPASRAAMSKAAHLAGTAINITKTTASHALSYTMTSRFGVPHGHAVALSLGPMLVYNSLATDDDVTSPQGTDHLRQTIAELNHLFGCSDATGSRKKITDLIESLHLPTRLSDLGIRTEAQRWLIVEGVNPERLANNPRALSQKALLEILEEIA
jgi:alcohol dehydrogenase class IV